MFSIAFDPPFESSSNLVHDTHPHAYVSPDRKWVVYNSDMSGRSRSTPL